MKNRFYIIGGQYEFICYGGAPTLTGAKQLAARNVERWDGGKGFHIPAIYRAEDTTEIDTTFGRGSGDWITIRVPKFDAFPAC